MQLFSIGLYKLNMDGTQVLDESGLPIETYRIEDIVSSYFVTRYSTISSFILLNLSSCYSFPDDR